MREAHWACIPPRYAESDIEIARYEYGVAGILGEISRCNRVDHYYSLCIQN